jgi:hypothetical protein
MEDRMTNRSIVAAALVGLMVLPAGPIHAQQVPPKTPTPGIVRSLEKMDFRTAPPASIQKPQRSTGRKAVGGLVGAVGGFFAGAFIGAQFTNDCRCDDPGLEGALYGAPLGAIIGAVLGAKFF